MSTAFLNLINTPEEQNGGRDRENITFERTIQVWKQSSETETSSKETPWIRCHQTSGKERISSHSDVSHGYFFHCCKLLCFIQIFIFRFYVTRGHVFLTIFILAFLGVSIAYPLVVGLPKLEEKWQKFANMSAEEA